MKGDDDGAAAAAAAGPTASFNGFAAMSSAYAMADVVKARAAGLARSAGPRPRVRRRRPRWR